jgi:hypothetical protein
MNQTASARPVFLAFGATLAVGTLMAFAMAVGLVFGGDGFALTGDASSLAVGIETPLAR